MQIHEVRCRFGRLDGRYPLDAGRLTLVLEENERGKTTLAEAILAALYGFPPRQREGDGLRERERFRPITGGPCFVELELTAAGRRLRLRRDINGDGPDAVNVSDRDRGEDVTAEFAPSKSDRPPGELLTGLTREQFLRICLVRQGQVGDVREGATLTERVQALVDTSAGERTANAAIEALSQGLTKFQGEMVQTGKVETEIDRLEKAAATAREQRRRYEQARDASDGDARRLGELEAEDTAAEQEAVRLSYLAAAAELAAIDAGRVERAEREQRAVTLRQQIVALDDDRSAPVDGAVRLEGAHRALTEAQAALRARQDTMRAAAQEHQQAADGLSELGPAATWTSADYDAVLAAEQRLTHAEHAAAAAAAAWERAYHNAPEDARTQALEDDSPFARLTDEDRRALLGYPAAIAAAHHEEAKARGRLLSGRRLPLLIAGAVFLVGGIAAAFVLPALGIALAVIGVVLAGLGWLLPVPTVAAESVSPRIAALQMDGARLAVLVGMPSPETAAAALAEYLATHATAIGLRAAMAARDESGQAAEEARAALAEWWLRAGRGIAADEVDAIAADDLVQLARQVRGEAAEVERLAGRLATAEEEAERAAAAVRAARHEWQSLCRSLGANAGEPESAIARARERGERRQERDRLERELRGLAPLSSPTLRLDSPRVDEEERRATLSAQLAAAVQAHAELADLTPDREALAYQQELHALDERRAARQGERQELLLAIARVLDDVRQHLPAALQDEQDKEQRLSAVRRYRDAVMLARQTMETVAGESHEAWAEELNARAGAALRRLAPGYPEVRFSKRMEINLLDSSGRAWSAAEVQSRLSSGVRDRIYLAVRLALAGFCSPEGDPLPLILDDPFATSDDEQAANGMRYLLEEIVPHHQVVVLTCHRARHEALRAAVPALWDERVQLAPLGDEVTSG